METIEAVESAIEAAFSLLEITLKRESLVTVLYFLNLQDGYLADNEI